ncbi:MAG: hypothetical protein ABI772_01370 [Bacteroidota bacterium]
MKKQNFTPPHVTGISKSKTLLSLLLMMLFFTNSFNLSAQSFTAAVNAETQAGVSYSSRFAGNDVLDFSSVTYEVATFQDGSTNAGITWNVGNGTYTGSTSFSRTSDVAVSDVSLLTDGGLGVFAVVTYYVGNSTDTYFVEHFKWMNSGGWGFYSIAGPTALINRPFGNTLRIDAADTEYTIVWDGGGQIYAISGKMSGLYNGGTPISFSYFNNAHMPDVAMFGGIAHITFVEINFLVVQDHNLVDIGAGLTTASLLITAAPPHLSGIDFNYPRIACPNSTGNADEWTVVAVETGTTEFFIDGWNSVTGTPPRITYTCYNDASVSLLLVDLSSNYNEFPTVTYDDQYPTDGIWVGWTIDNIGNVVLGTPSKDAIYPIILKCDNVGIPINLTTYWEVPENSSMYSNDIRTYLELSGRNSSDKLFLSFMGIQINSSTVYDLFYKDAQPSVASGFRSVHNEISKEDAFHLINSTSNNEATGYLLKLFDLSGTLVMSFNGTASELMNRIKNPDGLHLPLSLYLAQFISADGKVVNSKKIVTGH